MGRQRKPPHKRAFRRATATTRAGAARPRLTERDARSHRSCKGRHDAPPCTARMVTARDLRVPARRLVQAEDAALREPRLRSRQRRAFQDCAKIPQRAAALRYGDATTFDARSVRAYAEADAAHICAFGRKRGPGDCGAAATTSIRWLLVRCAVRVRVRVGAGARPTSG